MTCTVEPRPAFAWAGFRARTRTRLRSPQQQLNDQQAGAPRAPDYEYQLVLVHIIANLLHRCGTGQMRVLE